MSQTDAGWEEYYDYIFPDDESAQPNLKLLAMAKMWKKQTEEEASHDDEDDAADGWQLFCKLYYVKLLMLACPLFNKFWARQNREIKWCQYRFVATLIDNLDVDKLWATHH